MFRGITLLLLVGTAGLASSRKASSISISNVRSRRAASKKNRNIHEKNKKETSFILDKPPLQSHSFVFPVNQWIFRPKKFLPSPNNTSKKGKYSEKMEKKKSKKKSKPLKNLSPQGSRPSVSPRNNYLQTKLPLPQKMAPFSGRPSIPSKKNYLPPAESPSTPENFIPSEDSGESPSVTEEFAEPLTPPEDSLQLLGEPSLPKEEFSTPLVSFSFFGCVTCHALTYLPRLSLSRRNDS